MNKNILKVYQLLCAHLLKLCCGITIFLLTITNPAYSQLPAGFSQKKLTGDVINLATAMAHAPDGRIFIAERSGAVKVLQNGVVSTVTTVATTTDDEQGLLGITLHPQFASNGKCYLFHTDSAKTVHYLDMIVISNTNTVTSTTRIMQFDSILGGLHNGGAILFKGDLLYVAIGESGRQEEASKLDTYRGKILRLTEDGQPAPGNPYYNVAGASRQKRSIWAIGMRNPWRMALDPLSQKIFVMNVGGTYEEINDVTNPDPARNYDYGWGAAGKSGIEQDSTTTILPVFSYTSHDSTWGCAITTGVFFNPPSTNYPAKYQNRFYFSDWCNQWFRSIDAANPKIGGYQEFANDKFRSILGTSVGIDGNIYYIDYAGTGSVWRIEYDATQAPSIVNQPAAQTVFAQDKVTFSVTAAGAIPYTYQWQKNGVDIAGATAISYTINSAAQADSGNYRVIVTNPIGSITSAAAKLTVKPFNAKPVPHIITPAATFKWNAKDTIRFSASATDAEDGTLPAAVYKWEVRFYHADNAASEHWHPGPAVPGGSTTGSFIADNTGEPSPNIWFRLIVTVTDSNGRTGIDSLDIQPNKVILTADASLPGFKLLILGSQVTAPFSKTAVVGSTFNLQALSPQVLGDTAYEFSSWVHGGDALQTLKVPAVNTTYKAIYKVSAALQNPYSGIPSPIPGKIEIEDFDLGGEGVAYHDASTGNAGNQYRLNDNVDLEKCSEDGFNIGYVAAGEWLEYTVNVTTPGVYTFSARVANPGAVKTFHAELDGQNFTGNITVPTTGGFQAWQTVSITTPALTTGVKVLRISLDATDFNVNYVTFTNGTVDTTVLKNLALNKQTTVSSVENGGTPGNNAVDGSQTSRWSSEFKDPQSIYVDLGAVYNISEVKIFWENAYGKNYDIYISNDSTSWGTPVKQIVGNTGVLNDHTGLTSTGRYVRIYGTVRASQYGYSINELEVYGKALSAASLAYLPETNTASYKLYPNPVYGTLTIAGVKTARIFNIINLSTSQLTRIQSSNGTLNVGNLVPGTYLVEFKEGNKIVRKKFVKL
ncbi:Por secretion system C-terminal sorting domain-containing protein [Chitinophaga sp. CF118]|uniref:PQQ-dependent sugar dehydrogenase n=1 Tax=Chitinophaga sp. CF118 TaxID=1884367 RepID=UPI0008E6FC89|nr:PQQ-dependent sugar dehydrogenase [Chitinophaga sp. CF118]SFD84068.1 Por secretion system C-terminal sorting domain-containing protein [Chitinophaga sp. CF118]